MKYWIVADTHFNNRHGVDDKYIHTMKHTIKEDDVLIHLGDVCFTHYERWHRLVSSGYKSWLILGNHENKSPTWYLNNGWSFVANEIGINRFGLRMLLTHEPKPIANYDLNIHGHLHKKNGHRADEAINDGKHWFVESGAQPITLERLAERFKCK